MAGVVPATALEHLRAVARLTKKLSGNQTQRSEQRLTVLCDVIFKPLSNVLDRSAYISGRQQPLGQKGL